MFVGFELLYKAALPKSFVHYTTKRLVFRHVNSKSDFHLLFLLLGDYDFTLFYFQFFKNFWKTLRNLLTKFLTLKLTCKLENQLDDYSVGYLIHKITRELKI